MYQITVFLAAMVFLATVITAYITHIVVCVTAWTTEYLLFLIVGAIVPPIGIVHGVIRWFTG